MKSILIILTLLSGCATQSWDNVDFELYRMRDSVPIFEPYTTPERQVLYDMFGMEWIEELPLTIWSQRHIRGDSSNSWYGKDVGDFGGSPDSLPPLFIPWGVIDTANQ